MAVLRVSSKGGSCDDLWLGRLPFSTLRPGGHALATGGRGSSGGVGPLASVGEGEEGEEANLLPCSSLSSLPVPKPFFFLAGGNATAVDERGGKTGRRCRFSPSSSLVGVACRGGGGGGGRDFAPLPSSPSFICYIPSPPPSSSSFRSPSARRKKGGSR